MTAYKAFRLAEWVTYFIVAYVLIHGRPLWQQAGLLFVLLVHEQVIREHEREKRTALK
jgi:hypothetical protein